MTMRALTEALSGILRLAVLAIGSFCLTQELVPHVSRLVQLLQPMLIFSLL